MHTPFGSKSITLNGSRTEILPNETILQVAKRNRIHIPTLCYDPRLSVSGHCKVCLVEVDGKLRASCITKAEHGMIVETHSEKARDTRKKRVATILKQHKGNCATCPQYEFCGLLELAVEVGLEQSCFTSAEEPRIETIEDKIQINFDKCIRCGKCVRVCAEIRKIGALRHPVLSPGVDKITFDKKCERCGQCAVMCPTGAIVEVYREKPDKRVKSVCTYCATGCSIYLDVRNDKVVGVTTDELDPVGKGNLCVKGRFGFSFVHHPDRLAKPLVRMHGTLVSVSWDDAINLVAQKLLEIKSKHGPDSIGGIGSARATNEDNYLFQRMMRGALGTDNVDNCARLCHIPAATGLRMSLGISASTSSLTDLEYSDVILVVGSNTTEAHPISALHIKWARARGARVIVIDPRRIGLVDEADLHLQLRPGTNVALFNALFRVIEEEELCYKEFVEKRTEGFEQAAQAAFSLTLEEAEAVTGVPRDTIVKAARMYGSSRRAMIVSGLGVDEHEYGTEGMLALNNLALATGNIGVPGAGVLCLRGQNNVQGSCDMGCLPGTLPGYQPLADAQTRKRFADAWGCALPNKRGKNSTQMMDAARTGGIKALYIWGEDPAHTHGDTLNIRKSLKSLDFLVYQDLFLTETARYAHVVLPAVSFAEKEGTFTNTERRVRLVRQAVPPVGSAKPDWEIFQILSNALGLSTQFRTSAEIYDEIASLAYYFRGISHRRLGSRGLQWPCTNDTHPGTERLYINGAFPRGRATFYAVPYNEPSEKVNDDFPLILTTGRRLYHFNNGAQTRRTATGAEKEECLDMNPRDIDTLKLKDGQQVRITSRRGALVMPVRADAAIREGTAFASFHDPAYLINILTGGARDTHTDTYSYKFTAIRVEGIR